MASESRLQKWLQANSPAEDLIYKNAFYQQINFVRGQIARLLASTYDQYRDLVDVVGTHTSKSVLLPVYHIHLPDVGLEVWMRDNFHNWNVSIRSEQRPLTCDFLGTFSDENYGYCFCEGMTEWRFGPFKEDNQRFTVAIFDSYDLYCFFRCIKTFFGIRPRDQ